MSDVLARAAGLFVVPRAAARPRAADPDVVVFGRDADAVPVAAGFASARGGCVALWPGNELPPAAALPRPRALADRLDGHGFAAAARGRVAFTGLPAEPRLARTALVRLAGVTDGPLVTAVCGPRPAELDDVLAAHDIAVLVAPADADPDLVAAASAAIGRLVPDVRVTEPLTGPARLAGLCGLLSTRLPPAGSLAGAR